MKRSFRKYLFEFYKESYYFELERKDKLLQQVGLAVAILTIIGNLLAYFMKALELPAFRVSDLSFYLFFAPGLILTALSFWHVGRSILHETLYGRIPTPLEMEKAFKDIDSFNKKVGKDRQRKLHEEFYTKLTPQICEFTHRNFHNNNLRYTRIFNGLRFALLGLVFLIAAIPGHKVFSQRFSDDSRTYFIGKEVNVRMMDNGNNNQETESSVNNEPIEEPQWPQGHLTKEAEEKTTDKNLLTEDQKKKHN